MVFMKFEVMYAAGGNREKACSVMSVHSPFPERKIIS